MKNKKVEVSKKRAVLNTNLRDCLRWYLKLTQPLHKIKNKGIEVLSAVLYLYHTSNKKNEMERWSDVFSYDSRIKMREMLGDMKEASFNNQLSILRRKGAIVNNTVAPEFNPIINEGSKIFELTLTFNIQ